MLLYSAAQAGLFGVVFLLLLFGALLLVRISSGDDRLD